MPRPRNIGNRTVTVAIIAAVLVVLHLAGVIPAVASVISGALLRLAAPAYSAGVALNETVAEGEEADCPCGGPIAAELDRIKAENARLMTVLVENEELKAALAFREREGGKSVLARVVSESTDEALHGLVIDRGADDGIAVGQPVVAGEGIMIGKISAVSGNRATVTLLTDSLSKLAVAVQNGSAILGVLEGDRGLSMSIALIPQNERLSPGEAIVTSGIEPGIRRGLAVGVIEKVQMETQDPFQTATVSPFAVAEHPTFVQVLIAENGI